MFSKHDRGRNFQKVGIPALILGVGKKSLLKQGKQNLRTIISDEKVEAAESVSGWNFVKICVIMQGMKWHRWRTKRGYTEKYYL